MTPTRQGACDARRQTRPDQTRPDQTRPKISVLLPAAAALFAASSAQAALVDAGNGLINDTDLNITWTQDANLFKTMATASGDASAFVTTIINSVGGKIYDTPNSLDTPANSGYRSLAASDFNTGTGRMTWWGAQAWVGYLNSISYAGQTGWRLPGTTDTGTPGCNFSYSGTDCGYNVDPDSSELAHVFYDELGNQSAYTTTGSFIGGTSGVNWGVTNSGPFSNLQNTVYWLGTEYSPSPNFAWYFGADNGRQHFHYKNAAGYEFLGWAVRDGQVAAVPVPAALWLMGSALVGLFGYSRRQSGFAARAG